MACTLLGQSTHRHVGGYSAQSNSLGTSVNQLRLCSNDGRVSDGIWVRPLPSRHHHLAGSGLASHIDGLHLAVRTCSPPPERSYIPADDTWSTLLVFSPCGQKSASGLSFAVYTASCIGAPACYIGDTHCSLYPAIREPSRRPHALLLISGVLHSYHEPTDYTLK